MSDARDFLDASKRIEEAATEGPWEKAEFDSRLVSSSGLSDAFGEPITVAETVYEGGDREFIAHARTALPKMRAALEAVLEIHRPLPVWHEGELRATWCESCDNDESPTPYPCPTVRAIQAALAVNDEGGTR